MNVFKSAKTIVDEILSEAGNPRRKMFEAAKVESAVDAVLEALKDDSEKQLNILIHSQDFLMANPDEVVPAARVVDLFLDIRGEL